MRRLRRPKRKPLTKQEAWKEWFRSTGAWARKHGFGLKGDASKTDELIVVYPNGEENTIFFIWDDKRPLNEQKGRILYL